MNLGFHIMPGQRCWWRRLLPSGKEGYLQFQKVWFACAEGVHGSVRSKKRPRLGPAISDIEKKFAKS